MSIEKLLDAAGISSTSPDFLKKTNLGNGDYVEHPAFSFLEGNGELERVSADDADVNFTGATQRSNTIARVLLVYSIGETVGVSGSTAKERAKNLYLNDTPFHSTGDANDPYNFQGINWWQRQGKASQTAVPGFEKSTQVINVGAEVKYASPVTRTISTADVASVRVIIGFTGLIYNNDGDLDHTSVELRFDVYDPTTETWQEGEPQTIRGKSQGQFELQFRVRRPAGFTGNDPWMVRCVRLTADSTDENRINSFSVSRIVEINEGTETYPGIAYFAFEIDTEAFGGNVPNISALVSGVKVRVPSNYYEDPSEGQPDGTVLLGPGPSTNGDYPYYHGVWDGTFKWRSTSNPAWHLYHLATQGYDAENDELSYGAGIKPSYIDRYSFYDIARYNDAVNVSTGKFQGVIIPGQYTPNGNTQKRRRRFTINTQITGEDEALTVLQHIASSFRGTVYYGAGAVVVSQDAPKNRSRMFNNENVLGGRFVYNTTEAKDHATVAVVQYNDRERMFEPSFATYPAVNKQNANSNPDIARFGRNVTEVVKWGCDNEDEAEAYARWIVHTSLNEVWTVTFTAGPDSAMLQPGEVIEIYDRYRTHERLGGRMLKGGTATRINLDKEVTLQSGQTYQMTVVGNDGKTLYTRNVTSGAGTRTFLNTESFGFTPTTGYLWSLKGTDVQPRLFRVIAVTKNDAMEYEVIAAEYDPNKFAEVEQGKVKVDNPFYRPSLVTVNAPTGVVFKRRGVNDPATGPRNDLIVSWVASTSPNIKKYIYQWRQRGESWSAPKEIGNNETTFFIRGISRGFYDVRIVAENVNKVRSLTTEAAFEVTYATLGSDTPTIYPPILLDPI